MAQLLITIKRQVRAIIRRTLAELLQFLVRHPRLYKAPYNALRKHCPVLYQWFMQILRRLQIIGTGANVMRVRGDQEHDLSPLGEKILADLESIVPVQKGKK